MSARPEAILSTLQAALFALLALWLRERWTLAALIAAAACAAQLTAAIALLWRGSAKLVRPCAGLSLLAMGLLIGFFVHAGLHLGARFGSDAARTGHNALFVVALAIPWVIGVPIWQLWRTRPTPTVGRAGPLSGLLLLGMLLPPVAGAIQDRPEQTWAAQPDAAEAARATWLRWAGVRAPPKIPDGPAATVLLTRWNSGEASDAVRGDGPDLAAALETALAKLPGAPRSGDALVIDFARASYTDGWAALGESGSLTATGGKSPTATWRPGGTRSGDVFPGWNVPRLRVSKGGLPTRFDSVMVDATGVRALQAGWTAPPALTAETALDAAVAGARMVVTNQRADGRFDYIVKGPSGASGTGYSLPRHAGAAWFLARVAARTGDPRIGKAADRALKYLDARTTTLPDQRAFIADGRRSDGKAWVGTTALATLAGQLRAHPRTDSWAGFVASSVDDTGRVLGNARRSDGSFANQQANPYGQGQATLALASMVRGGHTDLQAPLDRAATYLDTGYAPLGGNRLVTVDDHWTCLAALAIRDTSGVPSGQGPCLAYLDASAHKTPNLAGGVRPKSGGAGGLAEAVVAAAWLQPDGPWRDRAASFAQLFLESAYRAGDAPFLKRPRALLGGFRDNPHLLDVRVDAVQHIGCALLGVEALLSGTTSPGALP